MKCRIDNLEFCAQHGKICPLAYYHNIILYMTLYVLIILDGNSVMALCRVYCTMLMISGQVLLCYLGAYTQGRGVIAGFYGNRVMALCRVLC